MSNTLKISTPPDMLRAVTSNAIEQPKEPLLDIAPFFEKQGRMPDTHRLALWIFRIEDRTVSFWGTLAEVTSMASLYAQIHDLDGATLSLVDYSPAPQVRIVDNIEC